MCKIHIILLLLLFAVVSSGNMSFQTETVIDRKDEEIGNVNKHPRIFFENSEFNFGRVFPGKEIEHVFTFENRGNDVLEISRVKTAYGFAVAMSKSKTVLPGKRGKITVTFESGYYRGHFGKSVTVLSNDPNHPKYELTLLGEIVDEIYVQPTSINFGYPGIGRELIEMVTIGSRLKSTFKIEKISSSHPLVTASIIEKRGEEYIVKVVVEDTIEIGWFSGGIHLETNSPTKPRLTIPFIGKIVGDLALYTKTDLVSGFTGKQILVAVILAQFYPGFYPKTIME
ncbi:MAG: hypothetical protein SCALA701_19400 [Candidatus Scalindua sp.]|nr:DUF1573 domain-containing protein [Planctomycetota bacterium]RZV82413.1 MAG: DUF1573 domain-containing protein [Candidatus Scalindua sp. SCAELEC01]GJQ59139.1 MAG: hypothetical protein SCALA701_19400 [Candidatus Scalindua sp.]